MQLDLQTILLFAAGGYLGYQMAGKKMWGAGAGLGAAALLSLMTKAKPVQPQITQQVPTGLTQVYVAPTAPRGATARAPSGVQASPLRTQMTPEAAEQFRTAFAQQEYQQEQAYRQGIGPAPWQR